MTHGSKVIEDSTELVVAGFAGHEIVEAGHFIERRNSAAVIGRYAFARMADQESEMKLS